MNLRAPRGDPQRPDRPDDEGGTMVESKGITRFGGSHTLHAVAMVPSRHRARPSLSTVQLGSNEAAAVLAFLDGLALVCSASKPTGDATDRACASKN